MSAIRAVVTDFGGVLTTPLFHAFAHVQEEHGIGLEALGMAMFTLTQTRGENPLYALERGEMPEAEFLRVLGEAVGDQVGRPVSMERFAERYFEQLDPNDELIAHLRTLKTERGLRLAMLTNNVREWEPRWKAMIPGIDELFETIVDSAFVGMRKPDPAIYELTLARLDLPAGACVFLDDLEVNCDAARALGMTAIRFESTPQAIAELDAALGAA